MNPSEIIAQTAADHGVTAEDITGKRHLRHINLARQDAIVRLRDDGLTFEDIGRVLNRHNSTIYSAYEVALQSELL